MALHCVFAHAVLLGFVAKYWQLACVFGVALLCVFANVCCHTSAACALIFVARGCCYTSAACAHCLVLCSNVLHAGSLRAAFLLQRCVVTPRQRARSVWCCAAMHFWNCVLLHVGSLHANVCKGVCCTSASGAQGFVLLLPHLSLLMSAALICVYET